MNNAKLPVKVIFYDSINLVKNNYYNVVKVIFPYIIVTLILDIYGFYNVDFENEKFDIQFILFIGLSVFMFILVSIKLHRIFLLNDVKNLLSLRWSLRENKFFVRWLIIFFLLLLIIVPLVSFCIFLFSSKIEEKYEFLYILLFTLLMYYFISRFSLILPATAIDKKENSIKLSWKLSKDNSLRLFFLIGILPMLDMLVFSFLPWEESIFFSIFSSLSTILIMPFEICILSLSYVFLLKLKENEI